jgi:hypothetical protein
LKPYLAIIYDSFLDAARSRVLWVLLFAWTMILAIVAPFSIMQGTSREIHPTQLLDRPRLIEQLGDAAKGRGSGAQRAVWKYIEPDLQDALRERTNNPRTRMPLSELTRSLNSVLDEPDLYDEKAWPTAARRSEMKELMAVDGKELSDDDLRERNRRLVELAFPGTIRSGEQKLNWIGYAGMKVSVALPLSEKQMRTIFESIIVPIVLRIGLGIVGLFIGIIVTSALIPDLFQQGSLHLLLSKPISRSWLLVAKFLGGTGFVLLNITYLMLGCFMLIGWRLDFWNIGLLSCIPIFVFDFMTYYSISTLTGLIWKNAIVSIVLTALFWGVCMFLGIAYGVMDDVVAQAPQIARLQATDSELLMVSQSGSLKRWDAKEGQWENLIDESFGIDRVFGPYWIPEDEVIYYGRRKMGDFRDLSEGLRLHTFEKDKADKRSSNTEEVSDDEKSTNELNLEIGPEFPNGSRRTIIWNKSLAILSERGIQGMDTEAVRNQEEPGSGLFSFLKVQSRDFFLPMTPADWQPESPMDFCFNSRLNRFVVFTRGRVISLDAVGEDRFKPDKTISLETDNDCLALVACNDEVAIVATNQIGIQRIELSSFAKAEPIARTEKIIPKDLRWSAATGEFLLLDAEGTLHSISKNGQAVTQPPVPHQGSISAFSADEQGRWWIAHHVNRALAWDPESKKIVEQRIPRYTLAQRIFYWFVKPLYQMNPKPAAVNSSIDQALSSDQAKTLGFETSELSAKVIRGNDLWWAYGSNALFIATLLGLGCWHLYRQDL